MKRLFFSLLLSVFGFGATNVPLTVQEALYPGSVSGINRTNEPVTVGVPLADSAGVTNTNVLGLTGASAAQFTVEGRWPSGNIKWVKVRAIVPSVPAGGGAMLTLTDSGTGNFGGTNLANDNGATITVATGAATFTINKSNFNVLDQVVIGSRSVVLSGASQGLVVLGPDPTAAYPGNATCLPTPGGSACATVYASANDPNSMAIIEENGPAVAVIKATGSHLDSRGNVYMHFTARLYFYKGSSSVKVTSILRNADYGTSNTFATAYKGYQAYELRISPNITGALNYTIANHTQTPTSGTLNGPGGTDSAYLYQAESTLMTNNGNWCQGGPTCVPYTNLTGYSIVQNGAAVTSGTSSQYPQGWADVSDSSGVGVELGQYQLAAYGNKSLEFNGGGADVRVGIWARQNNTASTASSTANNPYYMPWPQWNINDVYLNFHAAPDPSPANDFMRFQHYLVARAAASYYNSCNVFFYPLLDPNEENQYYASVVAKANPSITAPSISDLGTVDTYNWPLMAWRFYLWGMGGVSNQMEFRLAHLQNFIRRGFTGDYLDSAHFYKLVAEKAFPMSDGFDWRSAPPADTQYIGIPVATSANSSLGIRDWVEGDSEHSHWYGMPDYYLMSGDETIHDAIVEGPKDSFMNTTSSAGGTTNEVTGGWFWNSRGVGVELMSDARLYSFLQTTGDPDAPTLLANAQSIYNLQIRPDFCAYPGYPAGCVPDPYNNNFGYGIGGTNRQRGVSRVRGVQYAWGDTIEQAGCSTYPNDIRDATPFMTGILLEGLWEFRQAMGPGWANYNEAFDLGYGITQWAFGEMYSDDGTNSWTNNGFRYKQAVDFPNGCNVGAGGAVQDYYWMVQNPNAFWPIFYFRSQYEGSATTTWERQFDLELQQVISGGSAIKDELFHYTIGEVIYALNHPSGLSLNTVPITSFIDNGGGSYTISWNVPAGATQYRIKWGTSVIVDWIGFNSATYTFIGNPATTMNWFAATDAPNIPTPSGSTQSLTISTGVSGLTAANFMIKAYSSGSTPLSGSTPSSGSTLPSGSTPPSAGNPPAVTITAPANGSISTGTWTQIPAGGWPALIYGYDKSEYVASRKLHCIWGGYKEYLSSEHNNAMVCYSYAENRWVVLENSGDWQSTHAPGVGHTVSVWAYNADADALMFQTDGSGSNAPEDFTGLWWWYDISGLNGQDKEFSPQPWFSTTTPWGEMATYDPYDHKLILYDYSGVLEICDPNPNTCSIPKITGTAPPNNLLSANMVYNSTDHKIYIFGGGQSQVYTFSCNTNGCDSGAGVQLSVSCAGPDCQGNVPPARMAAGFAYSSADHIFLMAGGINSYGQNNIAFNDTWTFDPAALKWTELSSAGQYFTNTLNPTFDRLTYDPDSNVFILISSNGYGPVIYAYASSSAANYGRVSNSVTLPPGSLNRVFATSNTQSSAFDPAVTAVNGSAYVGWIESGSNSDTSTCGQTFHPYIQSSSDNVTWNYYPPGTQSQACVSIDPELSGYTNASKLRIAAVSGTTWEAHEKINHNQGYYSAAFVRQWSGTAWVGGAVGCFFGTCGNNLRQNPQSLIGVGSTPTLAVIEWNRSAYVPEGYLYVAQWNGSTWVPLGGMLNLVTTGGTRAWAAALATDGNNPAACWSEEVRPTGTRNTVATTPQIQCAQWNGQNWARFGSSSLNQKPTSWAYDPAMTYAGGNFYIAWTERTTGGNSQLFVCRWDGTTCTLLGSGPLNLNVNSGWAAHPSLATDGTSVYVAWEEQLPGQNSIAYVEAWNGTAWSPVGSALNADSTYGSANGIALTTVNGMPTAVWGELSYGNLRQVYMKQWNGSAWTLARAGTPPPGQPAPPSQTLPPGQPAPPSQQPPPSQPASPSPAPINPCDLNGDGVVNSLDVQMAMNQALGIAACTTADLQRTGVCTVVDVQRVVNASLGQACRVGQ